MNDKEYEFTEGESVIKFGINPNYKKNFQKAKVIKISKINTPAISHKEVKGSLPDNELSRIRLLIDKMPVACIIQDNEFRIIYLNPMAEEVFEYKTEEIVGKKSFGIINPDYLQSYFIDLMQDLQKGNMASDGRAEFIKKSGETILCDWNEVPLYNEEGQFEGIICMFQDVSERMENQWLLEGQMHLLEMVASGSPLRDVLKSLILFIEQMSPRVKGSILLLDQGEKTLHTGAGPSLPEEYNHIVDHLQVGEYNGSCGTSAFRRKIVISSDISSDQAWLKYKEIARHFNLQACTSIPIFGSKHQLLGTFAFYYHQKTAPSKFEFKLIETFSAIAGIAIEKYAIEIALKEKENQHRIITENIDDLIFICKPDGTIIFASDSNKKGLGLLSDELKDTNFFNLIIDEDKDIVQELLIKENLEVNIKKIFRVKHKLGSVRWLEGTSKVIFNNMEKMILLTGHDITENKINEDALRISENQLQEAEKVANLGSFKWNLQTDELHWTPQLYRIFGYDPKEISPTFSWLQNQVHPNDIGWFSEAVRKAINENKQLNITVRIKRKGGEILYAETKCKVIYNKDGKAGYVLGTTQDVSSRIKTEEELLLSEKKFRTAFEFANIGFCLMNTDYSFIKTNIVCSNILGYTEEEFREFTISSIIHKENLEELNNTLKLMLDNGLNSWIREVRLKNKNDNFIWVYLSIFLLRDEQNDPLYFILVLQDISEKKATEDKQVMLTQNLIKQNEALEQFSYITSHNLRSPIANILGLIDIFSINPNDPDREIIIENIKKAAGNLDTVIKDLNYIISFKKGSEEIKQKIVFEEMISMIIKSLEKQLKEANAKVILDFSQAPVIESILGYTLSVVSNLIENAIKYRSPHRELIIKISSSLKDKHICLRICDNGLGINLDMQKGKIFGMYKRFHMHVEGRGIGLHLVKTQMEAMGGKVTIKSKPQVGTCFTLFFKR